MQDIFRGFQICLEPLKDKCIWSSVNTCSWLLNLFKFVSHIVLWSFMDKKWIIILCAVKLISHLYQLCFCHRFTWGPILAYQSRLSNGWNMEQNDRTEGFHNQEFAMVFFFSHSPSSESIKTEKRMTNEHWSLYFCITKFQQI